MIRLYTKSRSVAKRFKEIEINFTFVEEEKVFTEGILICEPEQLEDAYCSGVKVMVVTPTPSFVEGMALLQKGIRGYGNLYMQKIHLLQALTTIKNDAVWLYPEMMQELIAVGSESTQHNEEVLASLSSREQEVAKEIEKGMSNKEIASALGITERTVKAHLSSIYEKLGISDRLGLAMLLRG